MCDYVLPLKYISGLYIINNGIKYTKEILVCDCIDFIEDLYELPELTYKKDQDIVRFSRIGHLEMVKYLYKQGANIHFNKEHAVRVAVNYENYDIFEFLVSKGVDLNTERCWILRNSIATGNLNLVKYLYEREKRFIFEWEDMDKYYFFGYEPTLVLNHSIEYGGYLNVVIYIYEKLKQDNIFINEKIIFELSITFGRFEVLKYFYELFNGKYFNYCGNILFCIFLNPHIVNGKQQIKILKYLRTKGINTRSESLYEYAEKTHREHVLLDVNQKN